MEFVVELINDDVKFREVLVRKFRGV